MAVRHLMFLALDLGRGKLCSPMIFLQHVLSMQVRMAERSKALRSGRSLVLQAWVRIPLLTKRFGGLLHFN